MPEQFLLYPGRLSERFRDTTGTIVDIIICLMVAQRYMDAVQPHKKLICLLRKDNTRCRIHLSCHFEFPGGTTVEKSLSFLNLRPGRQERSTRTTGYVPSGRIIPMGGTTAEASWLNSTRIQNQVTKGT
jgi:hypothetical protein